MTWSRLDRHGPKAGSQNSPDKALIPEVDTTPRPVFFEDEVAYIRREMIEEEENPFQTIYFVDVIVSRLNGKVTHYRVVGYHGKDRLD